MPQTSALLTVMIAAARKAARALSRDFGEIENLQVSRKGPGDFVTAADHRAEKIIFEELSRARPGYGFLLEERGPVVGTDKTHRFIVDPLDGTLNFMHGLPHFAISIALERDRELVAGVIYDVAKNELFWAEKGAGAYANDRRLRVSARRDLADALCATGVSTITRADPDRRAVFAAEVERMNLQAAAVRRFGAAALDLAYVAAGRLDVYWERALSPWDVAAGAIIVREAGGFVREIDGGDFMETGSVLATNAALFEPAQKALRGS
jgi:myo-inositol-1(or 4)-monophosphatase